MKLPWKRIIVVPAVADDEDGVVGVEGDVIEPGLLPRHNRLRTEKRKKEIKV